MHFCIPNIEGNSESFSALPGPISGGFGVMAPTALSPRNIYQFSEYLSVNLVEFESC